MTRVGSQRQKKEKKKAFEDMYREWTALRFRSLFWTSCNPVQIFLYSHVWQNKGLLLCRSLSLDPLLNFRILKVYLRCIWKFDSYLEENIAWTLQKPILQCCVWYDIFNCNWVATRWQLFSTHIHTNNTENDTKQTIHRTTQKLGRVRAVPRLCGFYPGICLTSEEKALKNPQSG